MGEFLITGASGFIASRLLQRIEADPRTRGRRPILLSSRPIEGYRWVDRGGADLRSQLERALDGAPLDTLLHLGAYTPKEASQANCVASCNGNIHETERLLVALPSAPGKIVFASTIDVYRFDGKIVCEDTVPDPPTLYGASKLYCERMLSHWCGARGIGLQTMRIGHVYGPGEESYRKLIPVTISRCIDGLNPQLHTGGSELRSFIHVDDICRMILESATGVEVTEPVLNLVSSAKIPVREVIETVIRLTDSPVTIEQLGQHSGQNTEFDNRRLVTCFGPEQVPFEAGLAGEIAYFRGIRSQQP